MGFNSAFKGLQLLKNPGNGRLNNLNDPVLNVLILYVPILQNIVHKLKLPNHCDLFVAAYVLLKILIYGRGYNI